MKKSIFRIISSRSGIILMAVVPKSTIKRVVAILNMKKIRTIGDFTNKAKFIRQSMSGNINFPAPPISVALNGLYDNDIKALDTAEINAQTKAKGTAALRDVAKQTVLNDMHLLQGYVQGIADANPLKAQAIVQGSGFEVKSVTPHSKDDFIAKNTKVSGTVKLMVNVKKVTGGNKRASFKWQMSTDALVWKDLPATLKGSTLVPGLSPGTIYFFRFLVILKDGESSWSQSVQLMVI